MKWWLIGTVLTLLSAEQSMKAYPGPDGVEVDLLYPHPFLHLVHRRYPSCSLVFDGEGGDAVGEIDGFVGIAMPVEMH